MLAFVDCLVRLVLSSTTGLELKPVEVEIEFRDGEIKKGGTVRFKRRKMREAGGKIESMLSAYGKDCTYGIS